MKFNNLPIWSQLLIFFVLAGAAVFLAEKYMFTKYKDEIKSLDDKIEALKIEIQKGKAIETKYAEFEREVKQLSAELEKLKKILPPKKEAQDLIRKVESLAGQSDLNVQNWQAGEVTPKEYYFEWPIQLQVNGSYHNLAKFFEKTANYRRLINVSNIRMAATSPQTKVNTISANFTAMTYVYKE